MAMFREEKATAVAALLLEWAGGALDDLKLMYLADRDAFRRFGTTITGDRYFSMKNGPILSATLDLMTPRSRRHGHGLARPHRPSGALPDQAAAADGCVARALAR
jgi:hypothetical protein